MKESDFVDGAGSQSGEKSLLERLYPKEVAAQRGGG
jgi:hypothetical protein